MPLLREACFKSDSSVPNQEMTPEYAGFLYGEIYRIAELLAGKEFGTHYTILPKLVTSSLILPYPLNLPKSQ